MSSKARSSRRRWLLIWTLVMVGGLSMLVLSKYGIRVTGQGFEYSDRLIDLKIVDSENGPMVMMREAGKQTQVSPQEFIAEVHRHQNEAQKRSLIHQLLDVTSWTGILWVGFGLLAQAIFMARMVVQWLVSEREGRSVVPESFWWLSLIGSSMLMIYFTWRIEIVGFLGQSTGWLVYMRNIWLIGQEPPAGVVEVATDSDVTDDPTDIDEARHG